MKEDSGELILMDIKDAKDWQLEILEIIKEEADDRKIYWYWEKTGGVGKSVFAKYLCAKHDAIVLSGKGATVKSSIIQFNKKRGYYPELIILDVSRTTLKGLRYSDIEELKNGLFFSTKCKSNMVIMNSPHIIIFANEKPDMSKLNKDRWCVVKIKK